MTGTGNELIFAKLDGFGRALLHAGPAFDTVFRADGIGLILFQDVDFIRADLHAVATPTAYFSIHNGMHPCLIRSEPTNSKIPNAKSQTNSRHQFQMIEQTDS